MKAQCQCGQLTVEISGSSDAIVACHCTDCQRRTGSPFGVLAYYPESQLRISGTATCYDRAAASGARFRSYFCPRCGASVYAQTDKHPAKFGIAVGTMADPEFPPPARSVWEQPQHCWVKIPGNIPHFPRGRS